MNRIRRICLFGGSGCSKSTVAAGLFFELKKLGLNIEHINEFVKVWAYQKYKMKSYDQFYAFAKQLRKEDILLSNGVDLIVTDSPLLLNVCYSRRYKCDYWRECQEISGGFEEQFPSLNIFLDRKDLIYEHIGRYEDLTEAIMMDNLILEMLDNNLDYTVIRSKDFERILQTVKNRILI